MVEELCMKHKLDVLKYLDIPTSVEKKTHIDVTNYSSKTSIEIINHLFMNINRGLADLIDKKLNEK
ncbi:hypothetical protein BpHYR1_030248 [Brachionus plicatilis]|uniref:Uncharacterized protein n=1 Tax=Brachionus plicatilis TaxID=10195 RepID=A0A3M7RYB2_BRAPC|nr:hypothetical protein BpHYR1_030248 [Brachionus plicatilis]